VVFDIYVSSKFDYPVFSQSLHAFSFALFHSAAISYLFYLYRHKSLAQQFFSGVTYGLGAFIGSLYAGYVYELYPQYLFLSATFIALMACGSIFSFTKNKTFRRILDKRATI